MPRRSSRKRSTCTQASADNFVNSPAKKNNVGQPQQQQQQQQQHQDASTAPSYFLCKSIVDSLHQHANPSTRDWFENYVKGTTWVGCKLPTVRMCVHAIVPSVTKKTKASFRNGKTVAQGDESSLPEVCSPNILLDSAVYLLEQPECDVKLAGMLILSECIPVANLTCPKVLDRLEKRVLHANQVNDWSSADWFASKVLRKIALQSPVDHREQVIQRILDYSRQGTNLWYRRCGIIPFVQYYNHRSVLPEDIGPRLIQACEQSLLASPTERFTQTGVAWVLRGFLSHPKATTAERHAATIMITAHGSLWNAEAKKSLTEKMDKADPLRHKILNL